MGDLIINGTPTGMIPKKSVTRHVPESVQEIVDDVLAMCDIGITMVHLHARDERTGGPSSDPDLFARIIGGIRRVYPELVICVSLSGRDISDFERRAAPLELDGDVKPDMGSLTLSSLNFNEQASVNSPQVIRGLASRMLEKGIKPELEAFDVGMLNYAKYLVRKEILRPPHYCNLIFGNIACAQADFLHAGLMLNELPLGTRWAFGGVGRAQLRMNAIAVAFGGGVRIGLEDNIWLDDARKQLATNAALVERIHVLGEASGRSLMAPRDLRSALGLRPGGRFGYGVA